MWTSFGTWGLVKNNFPFFGLILFRPLVKAALGGRYMAIQAKSPRTPTKTACAGVMLSVVMAQRGQYVCTVLLKPPKQILGVNIFERGLRKLPTSSFLMGTGWLPRRIRVLGICQYRLKMHFQSVLSLSFEASGLFPTGDSG